MKAGRLAFVLSLLLAASPAAALPVSDERPLQPDGELRLRMERGSLLVRVGDAPLARIDADLQPGQRLLWAGDDASAALRVADPDRLQPRPATVAMTVPAGVRLVLDLGDASLDLLAAGGGGLKVRSDNGAVRLDTTASDIRVDTLAGPVDAGLSGPGRLRVSTLSGSITVRLAAPAEVDAALESLSGVIRLRAPAGAAYRVELAQGSGSAAWPAAAALAPDGSLRLGEGGGRVRIASFSGAVEVLADLPAPQQP